MKIVENHVKNKERLVENVHSKIATMSSIFGQDKDLVNLAPQENEVQSSKKLIEKEEK
jgi:hypothetical protein